MSHRIRLLPSGREFNAESTETVLEAALHSGVNLPYNCSGGSCGVCKARLVEGHLGEMGFHDYTLSQSELQQGYFLACRVTAASDMAIEIDEVGGTHAIPHQCLSTRVSKLERIGEEYLILLLRTPRTQTLQFLAGQHVQLRIPGIPPCDVALASCPCNGMYLQFHLERQADVAFVRHAFEHLALNDVVEVEGPYGEFVLDEKSNRPLVMIAQDTGFALIKSLMEHIIGLEVTQAVRLLWLSNSESGLYMANLCRSWADALDHFRFIPVIPSNGEAAMNALLAAVPEVGDIDVYMSAGHNESLYIRQWLLEHGALEEHILVMEKRQCDGE